MLCVIRRGSKQWVEVEKYEAKAIDGTEDTVMLI